MTMRKLMSAGCVALLGLGFSPLWADTVVHPITKGDQLLKISSKYYGTVKKAHLIIKANPHINPDHLLAGETLNIPDPVIAMPESQSERVQSINLSDIELKDKEAQYWKAKYLKAFSQQDSIVSNLKEDNRALQQENANLEKYLDLARTHNEKKEETLKKELLTLQHKLEKSLKNLLKTQEQYQTLIYKYDELKDWKQERQTLLSKMNELTDTNKKLSIENENLSAKGDVFVRQNLASSEEFILKEKGRILSERLWVEKNKFVSECKVQLVANKDPLSKPEDLLSFLGTVFGSKNFFIDPSENKVIIRIPGDSVAGIEEPRLRQKYQIALSKLAGFIKNYSVKNAKIETYDSYKGKILDESDEPVPRDMVYLKQSKTILDYLSKKMLIPQSEMAIGKGNLNLAAKKNAKYFDLSISFEKDTLNNITEGPVENNQNTTKALADILADSKLKFTSAQTQDGILEFDLPRNQFFGSSDQVLSSGKAKLKQIINLFANTPDVGVEVLWAPGQFDRNEEQNITNAFEDLGKLKKVVTLNHEAVIGRVSFFKVTGRDAFRSNLNPEKGKLQKRIIFRVVPYSLGIRFATL